MEKQGEERCSAESRVKKKHYFFGNSNVASVSDCMYVHDAGDDKPGKPICNRTLVKGATAIVSVSLEDQAIQGVIAIVPQEQHHKHAVTQRLTISSTTPHTKRNYETSDTHRCIDNKISDTHR